MAITKMIETDELTICSIDGKGNKRALKISPGSISNSITDTIHEVYDDIKELKSQQKKMDREFKIKKWRNRNCKKRRYF